MLYDVHFSARGTTESYAEAFVKAFGKDTLSFNWLRKTERKALSLSSDDTLLFSMPVYGGYIPHVCEELISLLNGDDTPAVIVAVYGNRHYDNALIEMKDLLSRRGFIVIAAAAVVAEHSIFPTVATGRPTEGDLGEMRSFASSIKPPYKEVSVPGNPDWDSSTFHGTPFHPTADDRCRYCLVCVSSCPTGAIDPDDPKATDTSLCISCGACIRLCPYNARSHRDASYEDARKGFEERCGKRRENEFFL